MDFNQSCVYCNVSSHSAYRFILTREASGKLRHGDLKCSNYKQIWYYSHFIINAHPALLLSPDVRSPALVRRPEFIFTPLSLPSPHNQFEFSVLQYSRVVPFHFDDTNLTRSTICCKKHWQKRCKDKKDIFATFCPVLASSFCMILCNLSIYEPHWNE